MCVCRCRHRPSDEEIGGLTGEPFVAGVQVVKLQDELQSTKANYEGMVRDLTEHVCNLTEQLAKQDAVQ